jgi:hypothetical protein
VLGVVATGNLFAGIAISGTGQNVLRNITSDNGPDATGVFVGPAGTAERIVDNVATGNGFAGLFVQNGTVAADNHVRNNLIGIFVGGNHNVVAGNYVTETCGPTCDLGISLEGGTSNTITGNRVRGSSRNAIRVESFADGPPAIGNAVLNNHVKDAGRDGIAVHVDPDATGEVRDTLVSGNRVQRSGNDGIDVRSPSTTIASNRTVRNDNLGIAAVPGVTDGGGNRAYGNGNPPQCINVTCRR